MNGAISALDAQLHQLVGQPFEHSPALGRFSGWQDDRIDTDLAEARDQTRQLARRNGFVGHDHQPPIAREARKMLGRAVEQARFDQDGIGTIAETDVDTDHRPSAFMIWSTVESCGSGLL